MSESKHTPGPWNRAPGEPVFIPLKARDCERIGFQIGFVNTDVAETLETAQANAALIARAPDLSAEVERLRADLDAERRKVEALREALRELVAVKALRDSMDRRPVDTDDLGEYQRRSPAAWEAARAAIAATEGGAA